MKKTFFILSTLAFLLASTMLAEAQSVGSYRWQNNAGKSMVDTVEWSDQGNYSLVDSLVSTTRDTTREAINIDGVSYLSVLGVVSGSSRPNNEGCADFRIDPQVSLDNSTWLTLTGTFSFNTGSADNDTALMVFYDKDFATDTTAVTAVSHTAGIQVARAVDMRKIRGTRYFRMIVVPISASCGTIAATDSFKFVTIMKREYEADPK